MIIKKHSKINGDLVMKSIQYQSAKNMMMQNHYSKKWNHYFGKINIGIFKNDKLLGCASFGSLMNAESYKSIGNIEKDEILELNRMWISDELGHNSESILISSSIKIIKKMYPKIKLIQSFADGRLGCGTIYKASNFNYYGYHESLFFKNKITNEVIHKINFEDIRSSQTFLELNAKRLDGIFETFFVKTYRYIYILDKKISVYLKQEKYPKYEKGIKLVDDKIPLGLITRLYLMYKYLQDDINKIKTLEYIKKNYNNKLETENEIIRQSENDFFKKFQKDRYLESVQVRLF